MTLGVSSNWGKYRFSGWARRNFQLNQMVSAGADAVYEDECYILDLRVYKRYTSYNGDQWRDNGTDPDDLQDGRTVRLQSALTLRRPRSWPTQHPHGSHSGCCSRNRSRRSLSSPPPAPAAQATRIVAVVNGDVISNSDVDNRTRLFALSTGLPMKPDVLDRLKHQITRQLIDEKLRMQEVLRRRIVIADKSIADCDPRYRGAQRPAGRCAATAAQRGWYRPADLDRSVAHAARLDPGDSRAAWRSGEDHRCGGGRAAACAGAAGWQAGVSRWRDLHSR